jgi:hypothetical protein
MGYVAAAAGLATAALALLAGLLAAWGRRVGHHPRPTLSRSVGFTLAILGTIYLGPWWYNHARAASLPTQVLLALGTAALVLCLARFGTLAAVAVLSAGGVGDRLPEARHSRRHMVRLIVASLVLVAGAAAAATHLGADETAELDYAVRPTRLAVRVLGIDGFDAGLAQQMMERGELPHLARWMETGARARLAPEPEQVPAIVWTTIATGRGPEAHGIRAMGARRLLGMKTAVLGAPEGRLAAALAGASDLLRITRAEPPSAVLRTVKTFWNVAEGKGLRVGIVNWWATWPAEPLSGYVVSDRTFFKLERGEPFDRDVHPRDVEKELAGLLPSAADRARRLDGFDAAAAAQLRARHRPDLEAVYLPGLDIFTMQEMSGPAPADLGRLDVQLAAVRDYYRFLDGIAGAFLGTPGLDEVVILVADPGRRDRKATEGLLLAAGGPVRPGELGKVSERDVAPTLLHLVGLPVSDELSGQVLQSALDPAFGEKNPVRRVARYARRRTAPAASGFDREMIEELRSLGYIQ